MNELRSYELRRTQKKRTLETKDGFVLSFERFMKSNYLRDLNQYYTIIDFKKIFQR